VSGIWWLVWPAEVALAAAVLALLARRLWRDVKALGREVEAAGTHLDRLASAGATTGPPRHVPGATGDPEVVAKAREVRERIRAQRDGARAARLARAVARWRRARLVR